MRHWKNGYKYLAQIYEGRKNKHMQAVILAAGQSSRLRPFSEGRHKSFVSMLGKPLVVHTVEAVKRAGVTNIILVTDNEDLARSIFKTEEDTSCVSFVVQKEAQGMGDALLKAQHLLEESFFVTTGYHVDADILIAQLLSKKDQGVSLLLKKRSDYWKHGVVVVDDEKVLSVTEKPESDKDTEKLCVVGLYKLTKDFVETLKKIELSHYHLEIALDSYAKKKDISYTVIDCETVSLKYPWDLLDVKDYLLKKIKNEKGKDCNIAKSAEIIGDVSIGDNVKFFEGARIIGPCFIGNNVVIGTNAILRNGTVIEDNCVVGAQMEIKNSILMKGSTTHSGFIGDSVIGESCKIAAQFTTANVRLDRKNIKATVKEEVIDTGKKSLGVFMGSSVKAGINCSIMPGIIIGNNVVIGPSTTVNKNVLSNVKFYTKFQEIVEEKNEN